MQCQFSKHTDWGEGVILLFDKPLHWTSFNVVSKVRALLRYRLGYKKIKVGHAGTLDPLATGLLIVCVGKATKRSGQLQMHEKEYVATLRLGATTPSYDLETPINQEYPIDHITPEMVHETLKGFIGPQMQIPPLFSAKSVDGGRAYKLARRGVDLELEPAPVTIYNLQVESFLLPNLTLRIHCSKGTYIRSLARDVGKTLGSGAHLVSLRRTASGKYRVHDAITLDEFEEKVCH